MNIIYKYTSPSGGSYIGKTKQSREGRRKYEHIHSSRTNPKTIFHRAINKYGIDKFRYEVLMKGIPDALALGMEAIFINLHNPEYNSTKGGDGVDSETAKRSAIRRWSSKDDTEKRVASMKGKKKTMSDSFRNAQSVRTTNRNKVYNTIEYTCPSCSRVGRGPNMKRYHFKNCISHGVSAISKVKNK